MCEWASMMPGVTHLPWPSMTSAPAGGARLAPTATILPWSKTTVPLSICWPVAVSTVAPTMAVNRPGRGR